MSDINKIVLRVDEILGVNHSYEDFSGTYKWFTSYKGKDLSFIYKNGYGDNVEMYDAHGVTKIKNDGWGITFIDLDELTELFVS